MKNEEFADQWAKESLVFSDSFNPKFKEMMNTVYEEMKNKEISLTGFHFGYIRCLSAAVSFALKRGVNVFKNVQYDKGVDISLDFFMSNLERDLGIEINLEEKIKKGGALPD
jgi:hypothetical protein